MRAQAEAVSELDADQSGEVNDSESDWIEKISMHEFDFFTYKTHEISWVLYLKHSKTILNICSKP